MVSIIIPLFNSEKYISETIESCLNQTYKNIEIIIIDDGSTDESAKIAGNFIKHDSRVSIKYRETQPKGASACRNIGISEANGEYVIFLDSDDLLAPKCVDERVAYMETNSQLDFAVFKMEIFRKTPGDTGTLVNKYCQNNEYLEMFLKYDLSWAITCPIWRSSFLKNNNIRFDERYQRLQDPEFHTKILLKYKPSFDVFNDTKPDCFYRLTPNEIKYKKEALDKMINGLFLYVSDVRKLNSTEHLQTFFYNTMHAILFFYKLKTFKPVKEYYRIFKKNEKEISGFTIFLFYLFNKFGFTFKKGFGITRLWENIVK
jgi:glycosyltransferase involved in cell wall biosynthesis